MALKSYQPRRRFFGGRRLVVMGSGFLFAMFCLAAGLAFFANGNPVLAGQDPNMVVVSSFEEEIDFTTVTLYAPVTTIEKGTKLAPELFKKIQTPRDIVPEAAIRDISTVAFKYADKDLLAGEITIRSDVAVTPFVSGIQGALKDGHRAITIPVNAVSGIEGWASPGVHVDLLLTFVNQGLGAVRTIPVVQNATVLSFNGAREAKEEYQLEGVKKLEQGTVTLSVQALDAMKVATALKMGDISLSLRNQIDNGIIDPQDFPDTNWVNGNQRKPISRKLPEKPNNYVQVRGEDGEAYTIVSDGKKIWEERFDE